MLPSMGREQPVLKLRRSQSMDHPRCLRAFDVVVLSSRNEGSPMGALEAMALGVPLVATRVGGVPHLLESGSALLVPPEHPEELGKAIAAVREDREGARQRAEVARERVESRHSPPVWARAHLELYLQLVCVGGNLNRPGFAGDPRA